MDNPVENIKNTIDGYFEYVSTKSPAITNKKIYRDFEKKIFTEELGEFVKNKELDESYRKKLIASMILARYYYLETINAIGQSPNYYARSKTLCALLNTLGWTSAQTLESFLWYRPSFEGLRKDHSKICSVKMCRGSLSELLVNKLIGLNALQLDRGGLRRTNLNARDINALNKNWG